MGRVYCLKAFSEWVTLNLTSYIFQLYSDENKLIYTQFSYEYIVIFENRCVQTTVTAVAAVNASPSCFKTCLVEGYIWRHQSLPTRCKLAVHVLRSQLILKVNPEGVCKPYFLNQCFKFKYFTAILLMAKYFNIYY